MLEQLFHESMFSNMGQILGGILIAIFAYAYGQLSGQIKNWKKRNAKTAVLTDADVKRVAGIDELLSLIRTDNDADRAVLSQFKNGHYYASGQSVQKLVMSHCVCKNEIPFPLSNASTDSMQVTFISQMLSELVLGKQLNWSADSSEPCSFLKSYWSQNGTKFCKMKGVFNKAGRMVGVLFVQYLKGDYKAHEQDSLDWGTQAIAGKLESC